MGNYFSSYEENTQDLAQEVSVLKDKVNYQERIIQEQLYIIDILKGNLESEQCMKNGIFQCGGGDITKSILETKDNKDYEYLVFSGGGIKGISYCGVLEVLDKYDILFDENGKSKIKGFAGASAGSIIAGMLAIGMQLSDIKQLIADLDFNKIVDDKYGVIRDAINLIDDYGICPGEYIYNLLGDEIKKVTGNPDYSIKQLYDDRGVRLVIVTSDMNNKKSLYFYHDHQNEKIRNIPIRSAIRMSMGIPFIFEPVVFDNNFCVDGGVLDNFPIHVFDGEYPGEPHSRLNLVEPNPKVLGLKIITDTDIAGYTGKKRQKINNVWQYILSYLDTFLTENQRRIMTPANYLRTIHIITHDYPLTEFDLNEEDRNELVDAGKKYTEAFFIDE